MEATYPLVYSNLEVEQVRLAGHRHSSIAGTAGHSRAQQGTAGTAGTAGDSRHSTDQTELSACAAGSWRLVPPADVEGQ